MTTYRYKGFEIVPKRDLGPDGFFEKGCWIKHGWIVLKKGCNAMPAATWFRSLAGARRAIRVLLRVKGDAQRFWEVLQPFEYRRIGQRVDFEQGHVRKGRFLAVIENYRVVQLRSDLRHE